MARDLEPTPGSSADLQADADPEQVARTIVLRRLTASPRTRAELADDLQRRGVPDDVAERVLDRFVEVGLIDDAAYARLWAGSRHRSQGRARAVIRQELRRRGVSDEDAAAGLGEIDDDMERARARALVAARLPATARLERDARVRRLSGMLARRGYPSSMAMAVVLDALREEGDGDLEEPELESGRW